MDGTEPQLLGALAGALASGTPLGGALDLLVTGLGLRSAVLRRTGTGPAAAHLLAVAGEVVHAVPAMRDAVPLRAAGDLELPVTGAGRELAVLAVVGARPSQLPVLTAAAAVLGLALVDAAGTGDAASAEAAALLLEAEEDGEALADALHDGPVQSLVVARYACDAAVRGGDPALARDAVQEAVVALRRTLWHLRPRTAEALPDSLAALADRLVESGDADLQLAVSDTAAARLGAPAHVAAYRLVQAVARGAGGGSVRVALREDAGAVRLDVDGGRPLPGPDRWRRRLRALGGDLSSSAGRLRVVLPLRPAAAAAPPSPAPDPKACS